MPLERGFRKQAVDWRNISIALVAPPQKANKVRKLVTSPSIWFQPLTGVLCERTKDIYLECAANQTRTLRLNSSGAALYAPV